LLGAIIVLAITFPAASQCLTMPNGDMENNEVDSVYWQFDSTYHYFLKQKGWQTGGIIFANRNKSNPEENTSSLTAYEGAHALRVPENPFILSFGEAYYLDTCGKVPDGIGGYYLTDDSLRDFSFGLTVIFSAKPSQYIRNSTTVDTTEINVFEFKPTSGAFEPFYFSFHDSTVKKADSMLLHFKWFTNDAVYPINPDMLIDSLNFKCNKPVGIPQEEASFNATVSPIPSGGFLVKSKAINMELNYQLIGLDGRILSTGRFRGELLLNNQQQFTLLRVSDGISLKVFKLAEASR